jgi:hypothetical protein
MNHNGSLSKWFPETSASGTSAFRCGYFVKEFLMIRTSVTAAITAMAILAIPTVSFAQSSGGGGAGGGGSAGGGATAGSPSAGSAGAGTAATSGVPPGPANPGGLNNSVNDPSGAGKAARLPTSPGTNSAGAAQSSGSGAAANSGAGVTTGSARSAPGGPTDATGPQTTPDAAITEENKTVDRKLKSICRGC